MSNTTTTRSEQLNDRETDAIHFAVTTTAQTIEQTARMHPRAIGPLLASLAIWLVEMIYRCSNSQEAAQRILAIAQEEGLENWVRSRELPDDTPDPGESRIIT